MKRIMTKGAAIAAALGLGLSLTLADPASARARDKAAEVDIGRAEIAPEAEEVDSFSILTRPWSFSVVDRDTVIVWATPSRPYLLELAFPAHDLPFALAIGVTSVGSRVYARFDAVKVAGIRYPIRNIYELSREEARSFERAARES